MTPTSDPGSTATPDGEEMAMEPWRIVQELMGHENSETTRGMYEAPFQELLERHTISEIAGEGFGAVGYDEFRELLARLAEPSDA